MFDFVKEKTALVIVDMQNDFVRQGGAMKVDDAIKTVPSISKLKDFARENSMPVVFTKFLIGNCSTFLWAWSADAVKNNNCKRNFKRYYPDIDKTEECSDVIDELKPVLPEDFIIEKYGYSAFRNTNLIDALKSEGKDTIIVTGTVTQICVGDTVHDGFANAIKVIVASDGVSSFDPLQQKAALANFALKYGVVLTSGEIIAKFGGN
jgi:nicotinamidase-related amidase